MDKSSAGPQGRGHEIGRPHNLPDEERLIASIKQPVQNFSPIMHLRSDGQDSEDDPFGQYEGPCCFGGFLEICCAFKFSVFR